MDRQSWKVRLMGSVLVAALGTLSGASPAMAQVPVDANGNPLSSSAALDSTVRDAGDFDAPALLGPAELEELVGPVALYPDDLLAIVLPASTYPLEIVQAARFLEQYEKDSSLQPDEDWDESVTALLNYPEVLRMMDEDIDWTWQLGDAVVNQQPDVINAVESFRDRAYAAGNLKSDKYQTVNNDDGIIEIVPVNDEIIYVPYYEPERVVVRQVTPVYYYYPRPYPVYYYPYPVGYSFYNGYFWGVTTAYRIGWTSHNLHVHHYSYWGHPYYGHSYYGHYYRRPSVHIYNRWYVNNSTHYSSNRHRDGDYWRPRSHAGTRPGQYSSRTRSYRDRDVSRRESVGSDAVRYSAGNRTVQTSRGNNWQNDRSQHSSDANRQSRSEPIRFRERPEARSDDRAESRAGSRTSADNVRQPVTTSNNATREPYIRDRVNRPQPVVRRDDTLNRPPRSDAARQAPQQPRRESSADARPQRAAESRDSQRAPRSGETRSENPTPPAAAQNRRENRSAADRQSQASTRDSQQSRSSRRR